MGLLTWTYQDQKADYEYDAAVAGPAARAGALDWGSKSRDGIPAVERYYSLGSDIDGGGWSPGAMHADAEAVHDYVLAHELATVRLYARSGSVPDWGEDLRTRYEPVWRGTPVYHVEGDLIGQPHEDFVKKLYNEKRNEVANKVKFFDHPAMIKSIRDEYTRWHRQVSDLAAHFMGQPDLLRRYRVVGFSVSAAPWLDAPRNRPVREDCAATPAAVVAVDDARSARSRLASAFAKLVPALMAAAILAVSLGMHEDEGLNLYEDGPSMPGAGRA